MRADDITVLARTPEGRLKTGYVLFSDGKEWQLNASDWNSPFFAVKTGRYGPWHIDGFERLISPPKRVAALKQKLTDMGEGPAK